MTLAIFDLDNTLIANDSDYLWGQFLVDEGIVDKDYYEKTNADFYEQYKQGELDITAFLRFSLKPLADNEPKQLYAWRERFIETQIKPIVLPKAQALVDSHRNQNHTLLVITATNRFITEPIVKLFGIDNLIATPPEFIDGRYTGNFIGTPCFQGGKVTLLMDWLKTANETLTNSWFYSDSHNDLSLLKLVDNPVAVNPDEKLREAAETNQWQIMDLR